MRVCQWLKCGAIRAVVGIALVGAMSGSGAAQGNVPTISYRGRADTIPFAVNYAQGAFNSAAYREVLDPLSMERQMAGHVAPKDSVNTVVAERATAWLRRLASEPATGMELDPYATLLVDVNRVDDARRVIAKRLATPGLSLSDRVYTLQNAAMLFMDPRRPDRLDIAEEYVGQLATLAPLGTEANLSYRTTCTILANLFYNLGHDEKALKYFRIILNGIPALPPKKRLFSSMMMMADLLLDKPGGRAELDEDLKMLTAANTPTPAEIAADSSVVPWMNWARMAVDQDRQTIAQIGTQLPPVMGHAWLNAPHTGRWEQPLDDGKIRLIEFGELGCRPCINALPMMKRMAAKFAAVPNFEAMYVTTTYGSWDAKLTTPEEEVAGMKKYYVERRKITFPISIWAPGRQLDADSNMTIPESETYKTFHVVGTPRFILVDGHGRLRRVFDGYGRVMDDQLDTAIRRLINESQAAAASTPPNGSANAPANDSANGRANAPKNPPANPRAGGFTRMQ